MSFRIFSAHFTCKVCGDKMFSETRLSWTTIYRCECKKYSVHTNDGNLVVKAEFIAVGSLMLEVRPDRRAKLLKSGWQLVKEVDIKELTHPMAVEWVRKLEMLRAFQ